MAASQGGVVYKKDDKKAPFISVLLTPKEVHNRLVRLVMYWAATFGDKAKKVGVVSYGFISHTLNPNEIAYNQPLHFLDPAPIFNRLSTFGGSTHVEKPNSKRFSIYL